MNSFSNMEINDLLDNRFRLEEKHSPNYLAECFQRLFPTLGRMGLSTVIDEMARANSRCFNSSRLPVRGEILSLNFFFELWKRNFRFEGSHSDKFTFSDELKLAFRVNPREFWEVLVRADRDMGNYLKDSIELLNRPAAAIHGYAGTSASMPRELPQAISLNLRLNGSSPDDKTIRLLKEKLPYSKENVTTHEIAKICLQLFEAANPADYDVRRLAEELEKENGIRRLSGEFTAVIPKKALDRLSTKCVLEFFKSKPLASNEASAMERGVYTVTEADLVLINNQGSEAFWQSIIPDKSIRERTLNMWKLAGMDSDARRFAKGKQILIATERALSDALHKHSAEMRDVYPLCGRAGISTQEADKFMAMLYLCHDFYKGLANVYINTAMLARFGAPAARRLWDTIKTEGLKKDGVGKIQSRLETETEKLNREIKEAIASPHATRPCACGISASLPQGTAKVTEIDLKQIDFTKYEPSKIDFDLRKIGLSQMVLMARSDYRGPAPAPEISRANQENLKHGYYVLSEEEKKILRENSGNLEFIWDKIKGAGYNLALNDDARTAVGMSTDTRDTVNETDRIFTITEGALTIIKIYYKDSTPTLNTISSKAETQLKCIMLFYNFTNRAREDKIVITDTARTALQQAQIVYNDVILTNRGNLSRSMYSGYSGQYVLQEYKKGVDKITIIKKLAKAIDKEEKIILLDEDTKKSISIFVSGFNHVNSSQNTVDIGINSNPWTNNQEFIKVLNIFMDGAKYLDKRTLPLGSGNEKFCHHLVLLG